MKFPRKRRALDSRIQQITGSSSSLAVICLMVLAVGFTVARGDLLIVDMIPTLTGVIITPKVSFAIHSGINRCFFWSDQIVSRIETTWIWRKDWWKTQLAKMKYEFLLVYYAERNLKAARICHLPFIYIFRPMKGRMAINVIL